MLYPAEGEDDRIPRFSEVLALSVCVTMSGTHKRRNTLQFEQEGKEC